MVRIIVIGLFQILMTGLVLAEPTMPPAIKTGAAGVHEQAMTPVVHMTIIVRASTPYSASLETLVGELTDLLGTRFTWRVVAIADGGIDPLTGVDHRERAEVINCIQEHCPDAIWTFLRCMTDQVRGAGWEECVPLTACSLEDMNQCQLHGDIEKTLEPLKGHLSGLDPRRLPALIINDRLFDGYHQLPLVLRELCSGISEPSLRPEACDLLPQCITRDDCHRDGFISLCIDAGTMKAVCQYLVPVVVPLTTIVPERALFSHYSETLDLTRRVFPGIQPRELVSESDEATSMMTRHHITILPAYIFDTVVEDAYFFDDYKEGFYRQGDKLLYQPHKVGSNYFIQRPLKKGEIDIFYHVSSDRALETLQHLLELKKDYPLITLRFFPVLAIDGDGKLSAPGGQPSLEESIRHLVVQERYPKKFLRYLRLYRSLNRSTYWEEALQHTGLNPETIKLAARGEVGQRLAASCLAELKALPVSPSSDILVLIENREITTVAGRDDVIRLYTRASGMVK